MLFPPFFPSYVHPINTKRDFQVNGLDRAYGTRWSRQPCFKRNIQNSAWFRRKIPGWESQSVGYWDFTLENYLSKLIFWKASQITNINNRLANQKKLHTDPSFHIKLFMCLRTSNGIHNLLTEWIHCRLFKVKKETCSNKVGAKYFLSLSLFTGSMCIQTYAAIPRMLQKAVFVLSSGKWMPGKRLITDFFRFLHERKLRFVGEDNKKKASSCCVIGFLFFFFSFFTSLLMWMNWSTLFVAVK